MLTSLQGRLLLAGSLLVLATIASATFSSVFFGLLTAVVDDTLRASEELVEHAATITSALEREDDALLFALSGNIEVAERQLAAERRRVDRALLALSRFPLSEQDEAVARSLQERIDEYQALGDALIDLADDPEGYEFYHQEVNPALRRAVADGAKLRESAFLSMQATGLAARDGARRATGIVAGVALVALLLSVLAALYLARTVVRPIRELTDSAIALRLGDLEHRVPVSGADEVRQLAVEFNRMAESIVAFRRTNVGEVMRAKEMLEATLLALPDGVAVIGVDGSVETMNPMARTLLGIESVPDGLALEQLPLPEPVLRDLLVPASRDGAAFQKVSDAFAVTHDGQEKMIQAIRVTLPDILALAPGAGPDHTDGAAPAGGSSGLLLVLHDVTEFHRLDELRVDHIGVTSHELKTPLTILRFNLLLLVEEADNLTERQRQILATAAQGCEQLSAKVERLLDLTRMEAGELRLAMERVDLQVIVDQALRSLEERFADAGVTLAVQRKDEPLLVRGDPERLTIIVANLLSNALKYTDRGGRVTVDSDLGADGSVTLRVCDTGIGVPEELRERIFEKFYRVDHHRQNQGRQIPGVGIGLYMCRQIADAHAGSIRCTEGPGGVGSCFELTLPGAS